MVAESIFEPGDGTISGIWLYRAPMLEPKTALAVNPEWIRNVFFDFVPSKAGNVTFEVLVDGRETKNGTFGTTIEEKDLGKPLVFTFWYPARARTKGDHTITIMQGYQKEKKWFIFTLQETEWVKDYEFIVTVLRDEEK